MESTKHKTGRQKQRDREVDICFKKDRLPEKLNKDR